MAFQVLTVTQLNFYVKSLLECDPNLSRIFLRGEISNFTNHYRSGHYYLSIKDENAAVKAVMFKNSVLKLRFMPRDGMKVIAMGRVSVYERDGQYQFYIDDMQPDGVGALYTAYEQLKEKLRTEGLFEDTRKKQLPEYPMRIGIITAPQSAALQDMLNILKRRWPAAEIYVYHSAVQGADAARQLVNGIDYFNRTGSADVIIIGRGGGSIEDLWPFNDEKLARTIASSLLPVVSAVGHETDFTIADFAADLRAPTPSAAAELVSPEIYSLYDMLEATKRSIRNHLIRELALYRTRLERLTERRVLKTPFAPAEAHKMRLDILYEKLTRAAGKIVDENKRKLLLNISMLDALSPLKVLSRGYAAVFDDNGGVVTSVSQAHSEQLLNVKFKDGDISCKVI